MKKLIKILQQARLWQIYGYITPVAFVLIASGLAGIHYAHSEDILYSSWTLLMVSAIVWWYWTIRVIVELTTAFQDIFELVNGIKQDIKDVRDDVGNLNK
jgi:hypothetical protein